MATNYALAIGIDLGTSDCYVAVFLNGNVEIIPNNYNRKTPCFVSFTDSVVLVGDEAKSQATLHPSDTVFDVKRFAGKCYDDVQKDHWPFKLVNEDSKPKILINKPNETRIYSPERITALILEKLKQTAETFLGQRVKNAVISVPAYFNEIQRQATREAGRMAGLNVICLISSSSATAIAYAYKLKCLQSQKLLIFNFDGSSTVSVAVVYIDDDIIEAISTSGDMGLDKQEIRSAISKVLHDAMLDKSEIDSIIMAGNVMCNAIVLECLESIGIAYKLEDIDSPEEAVAIGAAIQAAVLGSAQCENVPNILLMDATPYSLGIETDSGLMQIIVKRNTTIPTKESITFATKEKSTNVLIKVYQGESCLAKENILLAEFQLFEDIFADSQLPSSISPSSLPNDDPQIEITFNIDNDNILSVAAKNKHTGREKKVTITKNFEIKLF